MGKEKLHCFPKLDYFSINSATKVKKKVLANINFKVNRGKKANFGRKLFTYFFSENCDEIKMVR